MTKKTLDAVNALDRSGFVSAFGSIYEHSAWVAEKAFEAKPFASVTALHAAMAAVVTGANDQAQLVLLRSHPDLAGRAALAGQLTKESTNEQARAGLDKLSQAEMERFQKSNGAYTSKFGFPFILAVKHWGKQHVLAAFDYRLKNSRETELRTALAEVDKIAFMRLIDAVQTAPIGRLSTHVLDTARGRPAGGVPVTLFKIEPSGERREIKHARTNDDGRLDAPALSGAEMEAGRYELVFEAGEYFLAQGLVTSAPAFLDRVPLAFAISNPEAHYHVPLLLSPWSYSTYRGS
ncbi:MAG TPA: 2-oxo-4-hydroxy-4-carboxy-5-ureidoimidazoline decarboxylase [Magnetospirillaceae bacterium]|jgi:2-oxo-4-hydroxy-4-carboxy-5-ureidoimidazoline decarboxylase